MLGTLGSIAPVLFFVLFGGMVAMGFLAAKRQMDSTNTEWASAAHTLGLSFTPWSMSGRPELSGAVHGLGVHVTIEQRGGNKNKQSYTIFRVGYPDAGIDIGIGPETAFHRMGTWFGLQDVEVRDPLFDESFVVAGDPASVAQWLTEGRRLAMLRLAEQFPSVAINRSTVSWEHRDAVRNADELIRTLRRLVSATHLIAGSAAAQHGRALVRGGPVGAALRRDRPPHAGRHSGRDRAPSDGGPMDGGRWPSRRGGAPP